MLNWSRLAAVIVFGLVIQVALLNQIVVWGAHPDLLVLFPVAAGLVQGPQRGAIVGFIAGLAADLVVQLPFGLSPLTFVLAGFAAGLLGKATAAVTSERRPTCCDAPCSAPRRRRYMP